MPDEESPNPQNQHSDGDTPGDVGQLPLLDAEERPELKAPEARKNKEGAASKIGREIEQIKQVLRRLGGWLKRKAEHAGLHDWLMVAFTCILTVVAVEQGLLARQNSKSSAGQINKIIDAANRIEDAADSFSASASHINDGVSQAVAKLGIQAGAAQTLASAAQAANSQTLSQNRPWIAIREIKWKDELVWGSEVPTRTLTFHYSVVIQNFGQSPARRVYAWPTILLLGKPNGNAGPKGWKNVSICDKAGRASRNPEQRTDIVFPGEPPFEIPFSESRNGGIDLEHRPDQNWLLVCVAYQGRGTREMYFTESLFHIGVRKNGIYEVPLVDTEAK